MKDYQDVAQKLVQSESDTDNIIWGSEMKFLPAEPDLAERK